MTRAREGHREGPVAYYQTTPAEAEIIREHNRRLGLDWEANLEMLILRQCELVKKGAA